MTRRAIINSIGCAVPQNDIHQSFAEWAAQSLLDPRERALFGRMVKRSGIDHRWSVLPSEHGGSPVDPGGFYANGLPSTAERMARYAEDAPRLALAAIADLRERAELDGISHLVVASCTGFMAPGVDQLIAAALGLGGVERTSCARNPTPASSSSRWNSLRCTCRKNNRSSGY
jgi:alpha-pyrone synthase